MKAITYRMIREWNMDIYDWMYYSTSRSNPFSYHHLIVPARICKKRTVDNGAILCENTSHPYWHLIERYDQDKARYIQKILVEVNRQRYMTTLQQYKLIDSCLKSFEREYSGFTNHDGHPLIKEEYVKRLIIK